jgi:hypothetical protein
MTQMSLTLLFIAAMSFLTLAASFAEAPRSEVVTNHR